MISLGLDIGHEDDPAALAVLQSAGTRDGSHRAAWVALDVGNIERGTPYAALADNTVALARDFTDAGYPVVTTIDATGIGAAVVEQARALAPELHIIAVTIAGGTALNHTGPGDYTVGKHRLTEVLQVALQQRGLQLATTAGTSELRDQLAAFVRKPRRSRNGRGVYHQHEAASGHDDLVLALELALWTGDVMYDQHAGVAP